jgi:NifU-like protein
MWQYSAKVRDHFLNPRNAGELPQATVIGEAGSLSSGDALKLYLSIKDDKIIAARFQTFGKPTAIASSSALTEMLIGKPIDEAARITSADISKYLDGLPEEQMAAPVLGMEALEDAYSKYRNLDTSSDDALGERTICRCFDISQGKINRAIRDHSLNTIAEITHYTKAGGGCHSCHVDLENLLSRARAERARAAEDERQKLAREVKHNAPASTSAGISDLQRATLIQEVLDREVRPGLAMDGGDMELVGVEGTKVSVKLNGHCVSCSSSTATMRFFVEDKLRELVDPAIEVIDITSHGEVLHAPPMR